MPAVATAATAPLVDGVLVALLVGTAVYATARRHLSRVARPVRSWLPNPVLEVLPSIRFEEG